MDNKRDLDFYYVLLTFMVNMHGLKDKKGITITDAFQKTLNESKRKLNKIQVDKGSEFYNRSMKSVMQNNDIQHIMVFNT